MPFSSIACTCIVLVLPVLEKTHSASREVRNTHGYSDFSISIGVLLLTNLSESVVEPCASYDCAVA